MVSLAFELVTPPANCDDVVVFEQETCSRAQTNFDWITNRDVHSAHYLSNDITDDCFDCAAWIPKTAWF